MPKYKQTFIITEMRKTRVEVEATVTPPSIGRDSLELALSMLGLSALNPLGVLPLKWEEHQYMVDIVGEEGD